MIHNQLLYFGFLQSAFLLCIYLLLPQKRKRINPYLLFLVFALFLGLLGKILFISELFGRNFRLILLSELSAVLFGSTLYLFTKSIVTKHFNKKDVLHYVPALVYIVLVSVYFLIPSSEVIKSRQLTGETFRMVYIFHAIGLAIKITYLLLSWFELKKFEERMHNEVSYSVQLGFLKKLHIVFGMVFLFWLVVYVVSIINSTMLERQLRPFIWMCLTLIILFISYYGFVSPNVFNIQVVQDVKKYVQSKLSVADLERLKVDLEKLMLQKKPYLNSKLLKAELAEMLGISNPELARLLNENIGMNFFEFVNYYRVKEFIALTKTEKGKTLTFFGLAQEAGFNSKATFNNAFKKIMGASPSTYLNNLK